jgi:hypothetical protein
MSGTKTVINRGSVPVRVTLLGRLSDNPSISSAYQGAAYIGAGQQASITYGNDANPYLNGVVLQFSDASSNVEQSLEVFQRGGSGSLDGKLNTNSIIEVTYNADSNSFSLSAHN